MTSMIDEHGSDVIVVIVEFALNPGREKDFQTALESMQERVKLYDGFLGEKPCRSLEDDSKFVTLFYFRDSDSMAAWRSDVEHVRVQELGREKIFASYKILVAKVEREYGWQSSNE